MARQKFFADHDCAAEKLYNDVGTNNVRIYTVEDYESITELSIHPPDLSEKWTAVFVASSGNPVDHRDWLVIAPYRVDTKKRSDGKCIDIDPVLLVLDSNTGAPHPSGVVAYHQNFSDRTKDVPGFEQLSTSETVHRLKTSIVSGRVPFEKAPAEVLSALHHMVDKFRSNFICTANPNSPSFSDIVNRQSCQGEAVTTEQTESQRLSAQTNYMTFDQAFGKNDSSSEKESE